MSLYQHKLDPEVFENARANLRQHGWGKGYAVCEDGSLCLIGSLRVALGETINYDPDGKPFLSGNTRKTWVAPEAQSIFPYSLLVEQLVQKLRPADSDPLDDDWDHVTNWNDLIATTHEQVDALLAEAAEIVRIQNRLEEKINNV